MVVTTALLWAADRYRFTDPHDALSRLPLCYAGIAWPLLLMAAVAVGLVVLPALPYLAARWLCDRKRKDGAR